jgi:para-nitrobenzyl esterase
VDSWVIPHAPPARFAGALQHPIPLLIGSTADEGTSLSWDIPQSEEAFAEVAYATYGEAAQAVIGAYSDEDPVEAQRKRVRWYNDNSFAAARFFATAMTDVESKAYLYRFTRMPPPPGDEKLGAYHGSDMLFVFGNHYPEAFPTGPGDDALTDAMMTYWTQFAATGDPNVEGLPHWPAYDRESDDSLELGHQIRAVSGFHREACDLLDQGLTVE